MLRSDRIIQFIETLRLPDGTYAGEFVVLRDWQKEIIRETYDPSDDRGFRLVRQAVLSMGRKNAKAIAIDTPIPTPEGWKKIKDIRVGDKVYGSKGKPVKVVAESEVFTDKDCYSVKFSDGSEIIASEDHRWETEYKYAPWEPISTYPNGTPRGKKDGFNRRRRKGIVTTKQISESVYIQRKDGGVERNHRITIAPEVSLLNKSSMPIPPYVLGAWLGDGRSSAASITSGEVDVDFIKNQLEKELKNTFKVGFSKDRSPTIYLTSKRGSKNNLQSKLRKLKIINNKHIPEKYLESSLSDRWALLQGLMDTDGTVNQHARQTTPRCSFCSSIEILAYQVWRLIRSLGIKATIRKSISKLNGKKTGYHWSVSFSSDNSNKIFRLERKQRLLPDKIAKRSNSLMIVSCNQIKTVPTKCIAVDSEDHLFLAGHGCIPTHNTALVSFLELCHLCGPEAVRNGQLYSLSIDREQAGILFNYTKNIVYMDEELSDRLNVTESRKHIYDPISGSLYSVLSGEKKGKMGKSSSFIAFDELAEFGSDRTLYDAMLTSTGAHEEPMIWTFSTQAPNDTALLSELIDYGEKIKSGELPADPTFKSFLYAVPNDTDDIWDEEVWKIANPALGDFRSLDEMRDFAKKAKQMPSMEMAFRNLYLNQRVSGDEQFISPDVWKNNGGDPNLELFETGVCFGGLDLSKKNDLTSLTLVTKDEEGIVHVMCYFWTPGDNIKERSDRDKVPYELWVEQGYLLAPPGKVIDYRYVAIQLAELHERMDINGIRFDRWRVEDLQRELITEGVDAWIEGKDDEIHGGLRLIPHGQGFKDMSPAVERLEDLLVEGKIRHGNHPVLTMCASNTRIQSDPAGGRKFDKIKSTGRIDGIVSLGMSISPSMVEMEVKGSCYEERGVLFF